MAPYVEPYIDGSICRAMVECFQELYRMSCGTMNNEVLHNGQ